MMPVEWTRRPCGCKFRRVGANVVKTHICPMHREQNAQAAHNRLMRDAEAVLTGDLSRVDFEKRHQEKGD